MECLMPHLADMMQINLVMQIASIHAGDSGAMSEMAAADEVGMLHVAEPGFEMHMRNELAEWDGPFPPDPLRATQLVSKTRYEGSRIVVRFERVCESTLVTSARRAPGDALSERERIVAEGFASRESYKEVARRLGMSPATARHLRSAYQKLCVSDKGELARLLAG